MRFKSSSVQCSHPVMLDLGFPLWIQKCEPKGFSQICQPLPSPVPCPVQRWIPPFSLQVPFPLQIQIQVKGVEGRWWNVVDIAMFLKYTYVHSIGVCIGYNMKDMILKQFMKKDNSDKLRQNWNWSMLWISQSLTLISLEIHSVSLRIGVTLFDLYCFFVVISQ